MKSEIRYILLFIVALYLAVVGHAMFAKSGSEKPQIAGASGSFDVSDTAGHPHVLPTGWQGSANFASLLNLNLDSRMKFADAGRGASLVTYQVGATTKAPDSVATDKARALWVDGKVHIVWEDAAYQFEFVRGDGRDTANLYVTKNNVRYLVPMFSDDIASSPERGIRSTKAILVNSGREILTCLIPTIIVLLVLYLVVAGSFYLVFWLGLKEKIAHRKVQDNWPKKGRLMAEFGHSMIVLIAMALFNLLSIFVVESGHSKVYKNVAEHGWGYWFFTMFVVFMAMDAFTYWTHRMMHHRKLFKYFHAIHHRSHNPSPWTTLSMSVNEIILNSIFMPIIMLCMPVHQSIAFSFSVFILLKNVFNHLGFELFPEWINKWLVGATFHETHHMRFNGNYSSYLTLWDRLMKTENRMYADNVARIRRNIRWSNKLKSGEGPLVAGEKI